MSSFAATYLDFTLNQARILEPLNRKLLVSGSVSSQKFCRISFRVRFFGAAQKHSGIFVFQSRRCQNALTKVMKPAGFNTGINLGKVAGAGILGHLHIHVVPRWDGDTNFMPVLADVKVMPQHLDVVYEELKQALEMVKE